MRHELVKLTQTIEWEGLENHFAKFYSTAGRSGVKTRLMVGLHILKHIYHLSDEVVCDQYIVNPYYNELRPGLSILLPVDLSKNILDSLTPTFFRACFWISNDCCEVGTRA